MDIPRARIFRLAAATGLVLSLNGVALLSAQASPREQVQGLASSDAVTIPPTPETQPAPTTSSSLAPTTTVASTVPAPTSTVAPPTSAPAITIPAPAPAPVAATPPPPPPTTPPAPQETALQRVERAYATGIPAAWRNAIDIRLEIIEGNTSWAEGGGRIMISRSHAESKFDHLVDVVAHEFGHQVAFKYGTGAYAGAAPKGWPEPANNPAEAWADCVQSSFTGRANPSHGLAPCGGEQLSWARNWLQNVPSA